MVSLPQSSDSPTARRLRVMTWNTGGLGLNGPAVRQYLLDAAPDVVFAQEVGLIPGPPPDALPAGTRYPPRRAPGAGGAAEG